MGLSYLVLLVWLLGDGHQCAALGAPTARTLHGHIVNSERSHQKSGDTIVFKENIELDVIRDGMPNMKKMLKRQYIPEQSVSGNILATALYTSSMEDMIYREEVLSDGQVISYAFVHNNGSMDYINANGEVLELPVGPDAVTDYIMPPLVTKNTVDRINDAFASRMPRIRRALFDEQLMGAAVIKLILFIDKGAIDKFKPLNNNDEVATQIDLQRFFTLVVNEMTIMYQTLKTHGKTYTRNGAMKASQDFAVQLVKVEFPAAQGGNFDFATAHLDNGQIVVSRVGDDNDGLDAFSKYIKTYSSGAISYDHAAWITGGDLIIEGGIQLAGIAWQGTLCREDAFNSGLHTSVNELIASISRLLAHELGHGFGMRHDLNAGCNENTFIMAPSLVFPDTTNQATFSKFTNCSATEIQTYTFGITPANFRDTCLLSPDSAFKVHFCQGFRGMNLTLDDQCKRAFGATSAIDLTFAANAQEKTYLQSNYVPRCVQKGGGDFPFVCTEYNIVGEVLMGTKCVNAGVVNPNNVCFHGVCTSLSLCNTNNQPTAATTPPTSTQPTPTKPPTTTGRTTQPPAPPSPTTTPVTFKCPCSNTACCRAVMRRSGYKTCCPECKVRAHPLGNRDCILNG